MSEASSSAAGAWPQAEHLAEWIAHLAHVLPGQAPLADFVHHNTLHGLQHLPWPEALAEASALTGAEPYWPEARFQEAYAAGRITPDDLMAVVREALGAEAAVVPVAGVARTRQQILCAGLCLPPAPQGAAAAWQRAESLPPVAPEFAALLASTVDEPASGPAWQTAALQRWSLRCAEVPVRCSWRSWLQRLTGEDVLERVRPQLQRHLAAHLDLGIAAWHNPAAAQGFYAAWRQSAQHDLAWELDELAAVRDEIAHLPDAAPALLSEEIPRLVENAGDWQAALQRLALELPGWSGMVLWREQHPNYAGLPSAAPPVAMADWLAVRVFLERVLVEDLLRRIGAGALCEAKAYWREHLAEFFVRERGADGDLPEALQDAAAQLRQRSLEAPVPAALWQSLAEAIGDVGSPRTDQALPLQALVAGLALTSDEQAALTPVSAQALLAEAASLSDFQRRQIWLQAYERHYRQQIFAALVSHPPAVSVAACQAQVICCMDDREEGTRRHLEEVAPAIETFGAAGFFGVAMYWQGLDDAAPAALCPVVVTPQHLIREVAQAGEMAQAERHQVWRQRRLAWRERLYQTTRAAPLLGPLLTVVAGAPALAALTASSLWPAWSGRLAQRWRVAWDGPVRTTLEPLAAARAPAGEVQLGFTLSEQVDRVAGFLRTIGLSSDFAPLVLFLGHGSSSRNNPHASAYACGACSGKHGGPNARVFATLANTPAVRQGLRQRGIEIPETTWFVAAEHNTCDDAVEWYDLEQVPAAWQTALDRLVGQLAEACRRHAVERCRRLLSAPLDASPWRARRHVSGRAADPAQARPELGHATNAAAFIGRRSLSRGLFLDRRVFLISYDPTQDAEGRIVENILLAAGPVGAGINLEYYFSSVDNATFGCGSKVTHNLSGRFGVMQGADSDLRTGLPQQMVEIHEPMRLLVVVEQSPERLAAILARQPALRELVGNGWLVLAACTQSTVDGARLLLRYCPQRGWLDETPADASLPQVASSGEWFAGQRGPLPPARIVGTQDPEAC